MPKLPKGNLKLKIYCRPIKDKIQCIVRSRGKSCRTEVIDSKEIYKLPDKNLKEVKELLEHKSLEELIDIMGKLYGLSEKLGYLEEELVSLRQDSNSM